MAEQSVTLNPGESKVVSFEAIPQEARTYHVEVNGLAGSFVAVEAPKGTITLYMTGLSTEEWTAGWYYADEDRFRYHLEDYQGVPNTRWRAPYDPCTPPPEYPIDLNNLIAKIETFSNVDVCPKTGYKGYCNWGVFGPFVVEDGGIYTLNPETGELT